jgi:transcriptional antiterminator RfaH
MAWIVVRTQPRREAWAQENIEAQGCITYCPREIKENHRTSPLFVGYIFCQIKDAWWFLKNTFGVLYPIMSGEMPAVIPDEQIEALRKRESRDGYIRLPKPDRFSIGQRIRVSEGPLTGLHGIYQGQPQSDRARVLFELMGRKTATIIDQRLLQAAA